MHQRVNSPERLTAPGEAVKRKDMPLLEVNTDNISSLAREIKSNSAAVVLFGAGGIGMLTLYCLGTSGIRVSYFCDSNKQKQGKFFQGIRTISPEELPGLGSGTYIFICNNYIIPVFSLLRQMGFVNIYKCADVLENTDFSSAVLGVHPLNIQREIEFYKNACLKTGKAAPDAFNIKCVDIVVTERCTLKCRDCSNLMQYYIKPQDCDLNLLLRSVNRFMECVDRLYEFRVLGGEPFVNGRLNEIIAELVKFKHADNVIIYTNGTIVPKGGNLSCLKNSKVRLDITNYGGISGKHDELVETLKANNIAFITRPAGRWSRCGDIRYRRRTENELAQIFMNCCTNDVVTLLHGKLYGCPFFAHAVNLKAIPFNSGEIIDLSDESTGVEALKIKIKRIYGNKRFISACRYCGGRNYNCPEVTAARQIKNPLSLDINSGSFSG